MLLFTGSTNHTLKSQFFSTFIVFSPCSFVQCLQVDTQIPQWINELSVIPYKNILNNSLRNWETDNPHIGQACKLVGILQKEFFWIFEKKNWFLVIVNEFYVGSRYMYEPVDIWEKVLLMLCKSSQNAFLANFNHSYNSHIFLFIVTISYDVLKVVFNILERSSIFWLQNINLQRLKILPYCILKPVSIFCSYVPKN